MRAFVDVSYVLTLDGRLCVCPAGYRFGPIAGRGARMPASCMCALLPYAESLSHFDGSVQEGNSQGRTGCCGRYIQLLLSLYRRLA